MRTAVLEEAAMDKYRIVQLIRSVALKYRSMAMLSELPAMQKSYDEIAEAMEIACDVLAGKVDI